MQVPLQITIRGIASSEALEKRIRDKAENFDKFFNHITSCRILVEEPHKHHHQGKQFNVRIDISVPGHEIVVNHDHHEDVYVALRDAFNAARRQLEDYVQQLRGNIKAHETKHLDKHAGQFQ